MAITLWDELGQDRGIFQWDINRLVILDEDDEKATRVDFAQYNRKGDTKSTETFKLNGRTVARIPNVFLQDARDIIAYSVKDVVCSEDEAPEGCECKCCGDNLVTYSETINAYQIEVLPRNRPPDYVYVDTECINLEWWKRFVEEQIKLSNREMSLASTEDIDAMFPEDKE